ncbi:hypothetical protein LCGC14_1162250 [marine sediment metagenome]|uniref:Uncharacterized protein n=1 Tax=marine sediment metagenome TaxID=412755 RepID=A0A0F9MFA9_9ZZZZ
MKLREKLDFLIAIGIIGLVLLSLLVAVFVAGPIFEKVFG